LRHLLRRFGFYLIALWASATLNFIIPRLTPGNPAQALMARMHGRINPKALHSLEIAFGVSHDPLWTQYGQYLNNLLHGDLGISITYLPTPVAAVIAQDLPWTVVLVGVSLVISFVIGTGDKILSVALKRNADPAYVVPITKLITSETPPAPPSRADPVQSLQQPALAE